MKTILAIASLSLLLGSAAVARADIFEWEYVNSGEPWQGKQESSTLVPDGAGVDAVPGANLRSHDLTMAYLISADLTNASFWSATLTDADLSQANLTNADFRGADLTNASFWSTTLTDADLSQANLTNANFRYARLTGANLTGAEVRGAIFSSTISRGFTAAQLYSTASYQAHDLTGIRLASNNLSGWNFSGQNLTGASLSWAFLTGADLTGAEVRGAYFYNFYGFTAAQLYSTASYQAHDLTGIGLASNNLSGWNFSGQNLTDASLVLATLTDADLSLADLTGASFSNSALTGADLRQANLTGANFRGATLTEANLSQANLTDASLVLATLTGANLSQTNLTNAYFSDATLTGADLTGADMRGASYANLSGAVVTHLIRSWGSITGLHLAAGQRLLVRDYDGNPNAYPAPTGPIPITIEEQFVMETGSMLQLRFEADAWDSAISFEPGIPVTLGGTLQLGFAQEVNLFGQSGRTFDLFDWEGPLDETNRFAQISLPDNTRWNLEQLYASGEVTLLAAWSPVELEIKPGSGENPVNLKSKGVLPMAILSTDDFNVTDVDIDTLLFGDPLLLSDGGTAVSPLRYAFEGVSEDGLLDLTLKFSMHDLVDYNALGPDSIEGLLTGFLLDGTPFEGMDTIRIVPTNGSNGNNLHVTAVPEPSTWIGFLVGAMAMLPRRNLPHR